MLQSLHQKLLTLLLFLIAQIVIGQNSCPITLTNPTNGSKNVPVETILKWEFDSSEKYTSLKLILRTTGAGSNTIISNRTSGIVLNFQPDNGLPENEDFSLTLILTKEDETEIICDFTFSTKKIDEKPDCTKLSTPLNGAQGVRNNTTLSWAYAPRAIWYRISMRYNLGGTDVFLEEDLEENVRSFDPPGNLPPNQEIYVTITPYNDVGAAEGCQEESFTTGDTNIDCEPHRPKIESIPRFVGLCSKTGFVDLRVKEYADEYRWFQIDFKGQEFPIEIGDSLRIAETGSYRLVAKNKVGSPTDYTICETVKDFEVLEVGDPVISKIDVNRDPDGLNIQVIMNGNLNYEFALNEEGPFQESPFFRNLPLKPYTLFVRDVYECSLISQPIARKLSAADFPAFFTPDGDGNNEIWKYDPPVDLPEAYLEDIQIFDRFGTLLAKVDPEDGWNGTNTQGRPMQPSVYWFKAVTLTQEAIHGYFALIR